MDWLSTDLAQKTLPNGKKLNFLIIVDRASGFIKVYELKGTKTRHVIEALQDFNDCYAGPPYWLTSDGVLNFLGLMLQFKNGLRRLQSSIQYPLPSIRKATERPRELYNRLRRPSATAREVVILYRV